MGQECHTELFLFITRFKFNLKGSRDLRGFRYLRAFFSQIAHSLARLLIALNVTQRKHTLSS